MVSYQRVVQSFVSLSPRGPSDNDVVLAAPSSETVEGNPVSMGCMFPTESLGSDFLPSGTVRWRETEWIAQNLCCLVVYSWLNSGCLFGLRFLPLLRAVALEPQGLMCDNMI
ncbi:hypothetical protein Tco_0374525 [Tanacetum coccineum]